LAPRGIATKFDCRDSQHGRDSRSRFSAAAQIRREKGSSFARFARYQYLH
jgi:hypothetical protein